MTDDKITAPTEAEVRASFPPPRYRLVGYDVGTAPDESGGWVHWTDHEAIVARLTAERASAEAYAAADRKIAQKTAADAVMWKARAEKAEAERDAALAGARKAHDALWELNPDNYDHDEVCKLNDGAIEAILTLAPLIGETHGYSPEWWNQRAALQPDPDARQADLAKAWQPIETAPKDGTPVLLWPGVEIWTGCTVPAVGAWASNCFGWICFGSGASGEVATHWMPLPPPPVQP